MIEKDGFHFMVDINQIPIELVFDSLEKFKDAKDYMRNHKFPGAAFSWGYPYNNIDFLSEFPWLTGISIFISGISHIDIVNSLSNLVYISWEDPIPFNINNPVLKELSCVWHKNNSISSNCKSLRSICVTNCKDLTGLFEQICILPNVARVAIVKNFSVKDCTFMKLMTKLEYLGLSYFTKLESLNGIEVLTPTLRYLDLDTGSKIYDHSHLKTLKKLEVLRITHKGIIKSLDFIQEMPMLKELVVVGPKLEDNNLSYCNHIPTVRIWR